MLRSYVYIMTNNSRTLYIGVTADLSKRISEHKRLFADSFTKRYKITKLIYFEEFSDIRYAIEREKQLKGWLRRKKIELIESVNPQWKEIIV